MSVVVLVKLVGGRAEGKGETSQSRVSLEILRRAEKFAAGPEEQSASQQQYAKQVGVHTTFRTQSAAREVEKNSVEGEKADRCGG